MLMNNSFLGTKCQMTSLFPGMVLSKATLHSAAKHLGLSNFFFCLFFLPPLLLRLFLALCSLHFPFRELLYSHGSRSQLKSTSRPFLFHTELPPPITAHFSLMQFSLFQNSACPHLPEWRKWFKQAHRKLPPYQFTFLKEESLHHLAQSPQGEGDETGPEKLFSQGHTSQ